MDDPIKVERTCKMPLRSTANTTNNPKQSFVHSAIFQTSKTTEQMMNAPYSDKNLFFFSYFSLTDYPEY